LEAGGRLISEKDLHALVRLLQEKTPLHQLSNMEARTVFDFMEHCGYVITKTETSHVNQPKEN
jgi:hypothetical protein